MTWLALSKAAENLLCGAKARIRRGVEIAESGGKLFVRENESWKKIKILSVI